MVCSDWVCKVLHQRASDPFANLIKEARGVQLNEKYGKMNISIILKTYKVMAKIPRGVVITTN